MKEMRWERAKHKEEMLGHKTSQGCQMMGSRVQRMHTGGQRTRSWTDYPAEHSHALTAKSKTE